MPDADPADVSPEAPLFRVVAGSPDAAEVAALTAVLLASGGTDPAPEPTRSRWADPRRALDAAAHPRR